MKKLTLGGLALAGAIGVTTIAPAQAATTTLTFAGNICGIPGDQACGNGSQIGQNYGDGTGVDVSYRGYNSSNGVTTENFLKHWGAGYGDLQHVAWTGSDPTNFSAEITFTALAGYELTILGFDAACYLDRATCRNFPFSIEEIGGGTSTSGAATPPAGGHDSFAFNLGYSSSGYVLTWGPDAYDGGLSNIAFDVRAIGAGAVPEPSAWALLIIGFGLVGGSMRRRSAGLAIA